MIFSGSPWRRVAEAALALAALARTTQGIDFTAVPSPDLDLSGLGRVALTGDFDAISIYSYEGQNENSFNTNGSQALLAQMPNGVFKTLESSDGFIFAACPFVTKDNVFHGVVVGGNFTSLGNVAAQGVALWDPKTNDIQPLAGLNGSVKALYCQKETDSVYVGGTFSGGNSTNAIVWVGTAGWNNMPFEGFNGAVNSITPVPGTSNVIFGGQFSTVGNTSITNNGTRGEQIVNLGTSDVSASESSTQSGLGDPKNIICKTSGQDGPGDTWLLQDGQYGVWKVLSQFPYEPTKIRLWNTRYQGRGTKTFNLRFFPQNGLANLTYTDPADGQNKSCDRNCPLSNDPKVEYQEFTFVNVFAISGFQIEVTDFYGPGGGLDGVQLLQEANFVYAVSSFNDPTCTNATFPSNSSTSGTWTQQPAGQNSAAYLSTDLQGPGVNSNSASVVFYPDIKQAGTYMVNIYTPGCQIDGTCQKRGIANVTAQYGANQAVVQKPIYQTNNFEKYDQIYQDYIDLPTGSFRPYVKIQPLDNQNDAISLVALRVQFILMQANGSASDGSVTTVASGNRLNALFEYNPNNATINPDFASSPINVAGANLSTNAIVTSMATVGDSVYIAGNFSTDAFSNIFVYSKGSSNALAQGGLNNEVTTMISWGNLLFMGGNFTDSRVGGSSLAKGLVSYDTVAKTWIPMGGGVNGQVNAIVPLQLNLTHNETQSCITVNGQFTQVLPGSNSKGFNVSDGLAIWVPAYNDWLPNLNVSQPAISGQLTYSVNYTTNQALLAGTISSQGMAIQDVVALSTDSGNASISSLGLQEPRVASLGQNKATTASRAPQNISGATDGIFIVDSSRNLNMSIVAGNFETTATNGSTIHNLAFINTEANGTNTITGIADGLNTNSTFLSLAHQSGKAMIWAGGLVAGSVGGSTVNGLIVWDLDKSRYADGQPQALGGNNVSVNSITIRPDGSGDVFVGGNFASAGQLSCPGLCKYADGRWNTVGSNFNGIVTTQMWQGNDNLLVGGNFTVGPNNTYLARLNANAAVTDPAWSTPENSSAIPGPVSVLTPANSDNSQYWLAGTAINGSAFLMKYDGSSYRTIPTLFGSSTTIRGVSVLSLKTSHQSTDLLDGAYAILLTGSLNVTGFGSASAALFNGTTITPFILSNSGNGPGSMSRLVSERLQSFSTGKGPLALGFIVLIALAIALGLIFLMVLVGMALERWRRRREGYRPAPQNFVEKTGNMSRIPPDQLLGNLSRGAEGPRV